MKKIITTLVLTAILAIAAPLTTTAQTRSCNTNSRSRQTRTYYNEGAQYNSGYNDGYYNDGYNSGRPNVYQRHRKAMNIAIATGAGAILGALLGGKKGALIGAGAGVAAGAIATKKQGSKNYYRYWGR